MSIDVSCQNCGKEYIVPDARAGQRFQCSGCGVAVSVPSEEWGFESENAGFGGDAASLEDAANPYAAPRSTTVSSGRLSRNEALEKTNLCAIFLYVVTGLSILNHLGGAGFALAGVNVNPLAPNRAPANEADRLSRLIGGVIGGTIGVTVDILVIVGAFHLHKLGNYSLAMTGAIISCIPCCGPCMILGIPLGIWALVLLNDPNIKIHFQSQRN